MPDLPEPLRATPTEASMRGAAWGMVANSVVVLAGAAAVWGAYVMVGVGGIIASTLAVLAAVWWINQRVIGYAREQTKAELRGLWIAREAQHEKALGEAVSKAVADARAYAQQCLEAASAMRGERDRAQQREQEFMACVRDQLGYNWHAERGKFVRADGSEA